MANVQSIFSNNIKKYRMALGLSQEQLAEKCSTSRNYISQIELGYKFASAKYIETLSTALGVYPHDLFYDTENVTNIKKQLQEQLIAEVNKSIEDTLLGYNI